MYIECTVYATHSWEWFRVIHVVCVELKWQHVRYECFCDCLVSFVCCPNPICVVLIWYFPNKKNSRSWFLHVVCVFVCFVHVVLVISHVSLIRVLVSQSLLLSHGRFMCVVGLCKCYPVWTCQCIFFVWWLDALSVSQLLYNVYMILYASVCTSSRLPTIVRQKLPPLGRMSSSFVSGFVFPSSWIVSH